MLMPGYKTGEGVPGYPVKGPRILRGVLRHPRVRGSGIMKTNNSFRADQPTGSELPAADTASVAFNRAIIGNFPISAGS
jgi:hypothetical protein